MRDLRLEALQDPLAHLAFLETYDERAAEPDEFWKHRAAGATGVGDACQWVADADGTWVGQVVVILFRAGDTDYYGHVLDADRAVLVGVYVTPTRRGQGILEALCLEAGTWAVSRGFHELVLDVHADNLPAIRAYARIGFEDRGERIEFEGDLDVRMRLPLGSR